MLCRVFRVLVINSFVLMHLPAEEPTQQGSSSLAIRIQLAGVDGVVRTNMHASIALPGTLDVDDAQKWAITKQFVVHPQCTLPLL